MIRFYKIFTLIAFFISIANSQGKTAIELLPDLVVTHIERLPRYEKLLYSYEARKDGLPGKTNPYLTPEEKNKKCMPEKGEKVKLYAHIKNCGRKESNRCNFIWIIDGKVTKKGELNKLSPGEEQIVLLEWKWKPGSHSVAIEVDAEDVIDEINENNNILTDRTDALSLNFIIQKELYDILAGVRNSFGSFSFEDWLQNQIKILNYLLSSAVYPLTPKGAELSFRIDNIEINDNSKNNNPKTFENIYDIFYSLTKDNYERKFYNLNLNSLTYDYEMMRDLLFLAGAPDMSMFDYPDSVSILDKDYTGKYSDCFLNSGKSYDELKRSPISRYSAKILNSSKETRRGLLPEMIYSIPTNNKLKIISYGNTPRNGVGCELYRLHVSEKGRNLDSLPALSGRTGKDGIFDLGLRPFGEINNDCSNGILLLKLTYKDKVYYKWLELADFNFQYWRGNKESALYYIVVP